MIDVFEDGGWWWAWFAAEVTHATDLTVDREFADQSEGERLEKAALSQQGWLSSFRVDPGASAVELRFIWRPDGPLRVFLQGRVGAADRSGAVQRARTWCDRIVAAPSHVNVALITDGDERRRVRQPLAIPAGGIVEIRKRMAIGVPQRPDAIGLTNFGLVAHGGASAEQIEGARVPYFAAVQPLLSSNRTWAPLLGFLSRWPQPVCLSVALAPATLDARFHETIHRCATSFGRLSESGDERGILREGQRLLTRDSFAVDAQRAFMDAQRRYHGIVFRTRITLTSSEPLDEGIVSVVGNTISPREQSRDRSFVSADLAGATWTTAWPDPTEHAIAERNLLGLDHQSWGWRDAGIQHPTVGVDPALWSLREVTDVEEASAAFRLPIAANGALPGFAVRRPRFAVAVDLRVASAKVCIGTQIVGAEDTGAIDIPVHELTKHAFVAGTTGSGKTSTTLALCTDLWRDHRIPFLVIEPVNSTGDDYRWLGRVAGLEDDLVVLTAGDDRCAPLRINPFEIPAGVRVGEHVSNLLACFDAAFGLWDPLPAIYRHALEHTYFEAGFAPDETAGDRATDAWPTLTDLIREMRLSAERHQYASDIKANITAASTIRIEQIATGPLRSVFDCRRSYPMATLLERPVVIELARLGTANRQEQALAIAVLLNALVEHLRSTPGSPRLRHVTIVEEAHKLLKRSTGGPSGRGPEAVPQGDASAAASELFADLLAEIRKYGEGIVIVEQDPEKIVADAFKNTNLKVMHRLPYQGDRELIGRAMDFDDDHIKEAGRLSPHHAFVHIAGMDRPALVRTANPRADVTDTTNLTDSEVTTRFELFARDHPAIAAALAPYADCESCTSVCHFRGRAVAITGTTAATESFATAYQAMDDPTHDDAPWKPLIATVQDLGSARHPTGNSASDADLDLCVFIHLFRNRLPPDLAWVRAFRRHRTSGRRIP